MRTVFIALVLGLLLVGCVSPPPETGTRVTDTDDDTKATVAVYQQPETSYIKVQPTQVVEETVIRHRIDTSGMLYYQNAEHKFSFYYPKDWAVSVYDSEGYLVGDMPSQGIAVALYNIENANVSVNVIPTTQMSSSDIESCMTYITECDNSAMEVYSEFATNVKKVKSGVVQLSNTKAYFIEYTFYPKYEPVYYQGEYVGMTNPNQLMHQKQVLFHNGEAYAITFSAPDDVYEQNEADFDRILYTFEMD